MPIDFPSSPTTNQVYTYNGKAWVFNGTAWLGAGFVGVNASSANTASYVVQRDASGDFSAGKITLEGSGSSTSAQLVFSGSTNNWIDLGTNGYNPPQFTTRSTGTKVVFYEDLTASSTDYAAGIQINALWFSIPAATEDRAFRFYGGITNIASLTGDGSFSAIKKVTGETLGSTVAIGTAPITVVSTTQVTNLNASLLQGYSTATANTVSTIVLRDASGNFSAGTITGIGIIIAGVQNQSADLFRADVTGVDSTTFISTTRPALTISSSGALVLNPTNSSAGSTNQLRFLELAANGTNYVGFKAPDTIASNIIWTLPSSDGTSGNVLSTNGSGNLSWIAASSGGSSGGSSVTTSATAPASPTAGNQWYDTTTGIIYTYVNDGTSSQWVQGSTATLATGVPAGGTTNQFLVKSSATDYATAWTGTLLNPTFTNYTETLYDAGTGSAFTLNLSNGTIQKFTTNANMTLTLPASTAGKSFVVMVAYGAANTLTWSSPSTLKWVGGTTPTATSVSGKIDIFSFFQDGINTYGTVYGQNF